jgi:hypothetical protein
VGGRGVLSMVFDIFAMYIYHPVIFPPNSHFIFLFQKKYRAHEYQGDKHLPATIVVPENSAYRKLYGAHMNLY